MTEDRISELRAICAEYERNKSIDEALGHGDQAADIAADGVGRKALEALPELLDELERERRESAFCKLYYEACCEEQTKLRRRAVKAEHARDELADCCEGLFELVETLSVWLANAYIDPGFLPEIETCGMNPPQPEDVIAYAKSCINEKL